MGFGKQSPGVRQPTTYRVLRVRRNGPSDRVQQDKRLIRRPLIGGADAAAYADDAAGSAEDKYDLLGFGVRVNEGRYSFACRDDRQIEIETLRVRSCIVLTFANLDRRIVGLLRLDGTGSDMELLPEFIRTAVRRTRIGDRTNIEVHVSVPAHDQAPVATLLRRVEAVHAIDNVVRAAMHASQPYPFRDFNSCLQWISASVFDLRVDTGNGKVSITAGDLST